MTADIWLLLNTIACGLAGGCCLAFVIRYHVSTRGAWASSAIGRNLMLLMACLAAALGVIEAAYLFGPYPFRRQVAFVVYLVIAYAAARRLVLQHRAQTRLPAPRPDSPPEQVVRSPNGPLKGAQ